MPVLSSVFLSKIHYLQIQFSVEMHTATTFQSKMSFRCKKKKRIFHFENLKRNISYEETLAFGSIKKV